MNKPALAKFVSKIVGFDSFKHVKKIACFAYYLQKNEKYDNVTIQDIEQCYDSLDYPKPKNIAAIMYKLYKRSGIFIPRHGGYRVAKPSADKIKEIVSPEKEKSKKGRTEKVYKQGQIYDFYKDVKSITLKAKNEVFVIDSYANEDVIDLYLDKLPVGVKIMILTNKPQGNFLNVAQKFKQKHGNNFKVRTHKNCHDRMFFVDKKCFVFGQSMEKAASAKPTYLTEIQSSGIFRSTFQALFDSGNTLV